MDVRGAQCAAMTTRLRQWTPRPGTAAARRAWRPGSGPRRRGRGPWQARARPRKARGRRLKGVGQGEPARSPRCALRPPPRHTCSPRHSLASARSLWTGRHSRADGAVWVAAEQVSCRPAPLPGPCRALKNYRAPLFLRDGRRRRDARAECNAESCALRESRRQSQKRSRGH